MTERKKKLFFQILCFLFLFLCGCQSRTENEESVMTNLEEKEPVTIRFVWWGTEERAEKTQQAVDLFMEKNPDIIVKTVYYPFEDYYENLNISAETGYMPDVWQGYVGSNPTYMEAGLVEALDPWVESGAIDVSDISENLLDSGRLDGKLYGLSMGCNVKCMAVVPEIYEQAGLEIPDRFYESWEALEQDLIVLRELGNREMTGDIWDKSFLFEYFCRQNGETIYGSTDKLSIGFSRETYTEYYHLKNSWNWAGITRSYEDVMQEQNSGEAQEQPDYAVYTFYSNQYVQKVQETGQEMELLLLPGPNTDKGTDIRPGIHVCMSSVSEHKEEAARLIDFLINDVDANRILGAERGVPASEKVREALLPELSDAAKDMFAIVELAEEYSSPSCPAVRAETAPLWDGESSGMLEDLEQKIMFGQLSADEAYDILEEAYGKD